MALTGPLGVKRPYLKALALLLVLAFGFVLGLWFANFDAQDACLDRGGRWGSGVCEGIPAAG